MPGVRRELAHPPMLPAPRPRARPPSWAATQRATSPRALAQPPLAQRPPDRGAHAARRRVAARQPHAERRPSPRARRSRPCRRPPGRRRPGSRWRARARASRGRRGRPRRRRPASSASRTATARARRWRGGAIGGSGSRPFQVAITRTGSPARPSSAARSSRCSRSCAVEGATSTTGPSPGGGSTFSPGGSHISGPTTRTHAGHSRGYSSCGSVATSVSSRESIVCTHGRGGSPSRARATR